ncbi:uncharacterized protein LOC129943108 [Eupeodes corollae]|uniref:uncharacterized protein LOC129943108 n=1 Tax=Eupeodes corollae TaxID=290404 RepID=UPI00248FDDBA|nr:uncharacterized protein LOC129943108 [Eupeodes corollae]
MIDEVSEEPSIIKVPLYCYHTKFFLVEELALEENYHQLHYGRCCVIGKVTIDQTDSSNRFIENIRLPSLPKKYSLPEGTIRLSTSFKDRRSTPDGKICEVIGDCILYDTINKVHLTAKDVVDKLNYLHSKHQSVLEYSNLLLSRYKPAIAVDDIQVLQRGHELAERNIEIRMLSNDNY